MTVKRIEIVSVPVSDQERALGFYRDALDFQVINDSTFQSGDQAPEGGEQRWLQLATSPDAETSITLVTWFPNMPAGSLQGAIVEVDDIEAARSTLIERGVAVEEIFPTPWGRFAGFSDPDGNGWSLHSA